MSTENNYVDVRLFYSKTGSAKYISHLDTMRAFQRAFRRCRDLDFWYTEGFNPHLYLTFALPLSLGYESGAETVDFLHRCEYDGLGVLVPPDAACPACRLALMSEQAGRAHPHLTAVDIRQAIRYDDCHKAC